MLVMLYRPEYTHQWGSKSYFTRIGLDLLSLGSSAELVKAILERGDVTQEVIVQPLFRKNLVISYKNALRSRFSYAKRSI